MAGRILVDRARRPRIAAQARLQPAVAGKEGDAGRAADRQNLRYRWIILAGLITAAIMEVLDTTIINVALPQMAGNLNATTDEIAWVATGYILSNVIVLPMTAWLSDRFGRHSYLSFSILLFVVSSLFCGTSKTLTELVFWRILQGAGGAALLSTAQATLQQVFPKNEQGMVQTLFILGIVVAPTVGPTLGGIITDNYHWSWVFFVNIPIGLVSLALTWFFLHDTKAKNKSSAIDSLGVLLLVLSLGPMQYVLQEGETDNWYASVAIQRLTVLSAASFAALFVWELSPRNLNPVVDLRVLKNKSFSAGLVLFLVLGFGLYGGTFIFPLFTQNVLGFSPTATGLTLLPGGIATAVAAMLCGRILSAPKPVVDVRLLVLFGVAVYILSMWQLGHLSSASGEPDTRLGLIVRGFGIGFLTTPLNNALFASLSASQTAQGSSFINLARQLGGSFGIAVLNTYITNMTAFHRADLISYLTAGDPAFLSRQASVAQRLVADGYSTAEAQASSLALIDKAVQTQASVMSYNDGFLLMGVTLALVMPAILLLRSPKPGAPEGKAA